MLYICTTVVLLADSLAKTPTKICNMQICETKPQRQRHPPRYKRLKTYQVTNTSIGQLRDGEHVTGESVLLLRTCSVHVSCMFCTCWVCMLRRWGERLSIRGYDSYTFTILETFGTILETFGRQDGSFVLGSRKWCTHPWGRSTRGTAGPSTNLLCKK